MKKIFQVIAMAATASMIAGCMCSKNCETMTASEEIRDEIEALQETVEVQECKYENDTVKKLFQEIPFLNQQNLLKSLDVVLEANDGSVQYQIMIKRESYAKVITKKQGRITEVSILNGNTAYTSKDGIEFTEVPVANMAALYSLFLDFQNNAREVSHPHGKTFLYDGAKNDKIVHESLEVNVTKDGTRSSQINAVIATRDFTASTLFFCSADALRLPQQLDVTISSNKYRITFDRFIAVSLKVPAAKEEKTIIQPTAVSLLLPGMKKPVAFTVKKFQPDATFKKNEFAPAIIIKAAPAPKAPAPKAPAKGK